MLILLLLLQLQLLGTVVVAEGPVVWNGRRGFLTAPKLSMWSSSVICRAEYFMVAMCGGRWGGSSKRVTTRKNTTTWVLYYYSRITIGMTRRPVQSRVPYLYAGFPNMTRDTRHMTRDRTFEPHHSALIRVGAGSHNLKFVSGI